MKIKKLIFLGTMLLMLCALALLSVSAAGLTEAGKELQKYDINEDERITISDVTALLNYLSSSCGHEAFSFPDQPPTCEEPGFTGGKYCKNCNVLLEQFTAVPETGHDEVIDEAVAPTCTQSGLSEGSHCNTCGKVLVAQESVKETGHSFGNWEITKESTITEEGVMERVCNCGEKETQTIEKLSRVLEYTLNTDEQSYSVTGIGTWTDAELIIPTTYNGLPVTSIGYRAFQACTNLTSVTIHTGITSIGKRAFYGCTGLTSITIPESVESIGVSAFYGCTGLKSVTIKPGVTSIGMSAFLGCTGITSIVIPDSVESIGHDAFYDCTGLTSMTIPFAGDFGALFGATSNDENNTYVPKSLKNVVITGGTSIGMEEFKKCTGLVSITIPDSVTNIGYGAFSGCTGLISVTLGNGVESIEEYAFKDCWGLKNIVIPDSVISIGGYAFGSCFTLESVTIGKGVTSIENYAFSSCNKLKSIVFNDTTTWYCTPSYSDWVSKSGGTPMTVTSALTNANYFYSTYCEYYWYKK